MLNVLPLCFGETIWKLIILKEFKFQKKHKSELQAKWVKWAHAPSKQLKSFQAGSSAAESTI